MTNDIKEFAILKHFNIDIHPIKANNITIINGRPPPMGMIKCNVDGVARGAPSPTAYASIFHVNTNDLIGGFTALIDNLVKHMPLEQSL